jgi:hypothetical protein
MGIYTVETNPDADSVVNEVLDLIVGRVLALMGEHIQAIVLVGGYGRGEGGVYKDGKDYELVNDLDIAVFVKRRYHYIKRKYGELLNKCAEELQPKAKGVKQIDIEITNSWNYRLVPNLVNYYEIKNGHKVLFGEIALSRIMPPLKAEELPVFDGTIYFYSRGSGLLLPGIYFLSNRFAERKVRENFQIEIQKACIAMGDALLLKAKKYHYSYKERLVRFKDIEKCKGIIPNSLLQKISPLYDWAVKRKMNPLFNWSGDGTMINSWFEVRDVFNQFFLWFESDRLNTCFHDWMEYSDYIYKRGASEPATFKIRNFVQNWRNKIFFGGNLFTQNMGFIWKSKMSFLLPVMPLLLFSLGKDLRANQDYLASASAKLDFTNNNKSLDWLDLTKNYLCLYHPGGVVSEALQM